MLNRRVDIHPIDVTPARWRGDAGSSPLDGASTAASSPRNDLVKNHQVRHLISTQILALLRWEWTCGFDVQDMDLKTLVAAAAATDAIEERCLRLRARADSQDAWIFRAPVRFRGVRLVAFPRLRMPRRRRAGGIDSTRAGTAPGDFRHGVGKSEMRQPRRVRPWGGGLRRREPGLRAAAAPRPACLLLRQWYGASPESGAELYVAGRGAGRDALRAARGPVGLLSFVCCSTSNGVHDSD